MLRIEINEVTKNYGEKLILEIKNMKIYDQDRMGIVGVNGAGKSTFLKLLADEIQPDTGSIKKHGTFSYISQLSSIKKEKVPRKWIKEWHLPKNAYDSMSGGEKTRYKIAQSFTKNA